jgi:hypothetical protein
VVQLHQSNVSNERVEGRASRHQAGAHAGILGVERLVGTERNRLNDDIEIHPAGQHYLAGRRPVGPVALEIDSRRLHRGAVLKLVPERLRRPKGRAILAGRRGISAIERVRLSIEPDRLHHRPVVGRLDARDFGKKLELNPGIQQMLIERGNDDLAHAGLDVPHHRPLVGADQTHDDAQRGAGGVGRVGGVAILVLEHGVVKHAHDAR